VEKKKVPPKSENVPPAPALGSVSAVLGKGRNRGQRYYSRNVSNETGLGIKIYNIKVVFRVEDANGQNIRTRFS
jgi:hypothetical protein